MGGATRLSIILTCCHQKQTVKPGFEGNGFIWEVPEPQKEEVRERKEDRVCGQASYQCGLPEFHPMGKLSKWCKTHTSDLCPSKGELGVFKYQLLPSLVKGGWPWGGDEREVELFPGILNLPCAWAEEPSVASKTVFRKRTADLGSGKSWGPLGTDHKFLLQHSQHRKEEHVYISVDKREVFSEIQHLLMIETLRN